MTELATAPISAGLLLIIVLSFLGAILSEKLKVSYPTVMIVIGFLLSFLRIAGGLGTLTLDRGIILGVVVPPLIFEAAMRTRYEIFNTVKITVLFLAIFGVIISALLSGLALNLMLGLPLVVALTFGVIISPTDPVSVVGILKRLRAPEKLSTILETEAYFNDATAVILYPIAITLSFNPLQSASLFAYNFGGGVLIGFIVSGLSEVLYRLVTEPLAETYFTVAVMFGSYAFAESLGVSGLVAVAIAGLYMGNRTMRVAMSKQTRETLTRFWEVVTFMATSFVFLLLGLKADFSLLITYAPFILIAFAVILGARLIMVYPTVAFAKLIGEKIPKAWTKIIAAAGLRGAVSVALALSLPEELPFKSTVVAMAFGIALLSLVGQGESLRFYLSKHRRQLAKKN
jgi:CPA1 family monovalent cation:H+ antiporter